jgi:hypothetical protein
MEVGLITQREVSGIWKKEKIFSRYGNGSITKRLLT